MLRQRFGIRLRLGDQVAVSIIYKKLVPLKVSFVQLVSVTDIIIIVVAYFLTCTTTLYDIANTDA